MTSMIGCGGVTPNYNKSGWYPLELKESNNDNDAYKLPSQVLRTAATSATNSLDVPYPSLEFDYDSVFDKPLDRPFEYHVYFHFAEIQQLPDGQKRRINITLNSKSVLSKPLVLEYLKPVTTLKYSTRGYVWFSISATSESDAPLSSTPMRSIRNLSSSNLAGQITTSFSYLTELEFLDLSYNELEGPLPEFLAELPNLKSWNKLSGPIPKALKEKADTTLQLSVADNPELFVRSDSKKGDSLKSKLQAFSYNEILNITDNFKTVIGKGGFGKVYFGFLQHHTRVAVKLLSRSSMQGYKEFRSEAQLLMTAHHRNLVSLIGYCDEGEIKALIYEYMANGNLQQHLSADFGLSRAFGNDIDSHVSTRPAGTLGYVDPEFQRTGNSNKKCDIYSFGIILFELITGQKALVRAPGKNINMHILEWVIPIVEKGDIQDIVDRRLKGEFSINSAWKAVEIAMSCTSTTAVVRPDISQILVDLKECLSLEMVQRNRESGRTTIELTTSVQIDLETAPFAR
ncbi:Serine-threonine/tyrosine-protein kinase, catalytic domain [Sesbania bispinosa]|nr:Serine-threonine/tyrosine-protein kinase, catalytic domain [Sesbania bispinosa]